jgi:carboxyl-terminal processing protease
VNASRLLTLVLLSLSLGACGPPSGSFPVVDNRDGQAAGLPPKQAGLAELPPDPREGVLAQMVGKILSDEHLRKRALDDHLSEQAFTEYVKNLDPMKLFLRKEDVRTLRIWSSRMDDELRAGDLRLARVGAAMLDARRKKMADVVNKTLSKPFDFAVVEQLEMDPDKIEYADSDAALADRWRKVLKVQALQRIAQMEETEKALAEGKKDEETDAATKGLDEIPPTLEGKEKKAREAMTTSYSARFKRMEDRDPLEPAETFLNAVAKIFDPHTVYLAPAEKENFDIQMSGSLEGIGAVLAEEDHYIVVREVVPGGASWRQGKLKSGDTILAVAQAGEEAIDVADMPIGKVVKLIRGPKGTVVKLTVKKPDNKIDVIAITRDVVMIEDAYARGAVLDLGDQHDSMGYIYLPSFYGEMKRGGNGSARNASADVKALLDQFTKQKLGGVIVDLRGNPGGLLGHARDITGLFIETGPVVQTRYSDGEMQVLSDKDPSIAFHGEVIVLVDRFSASASEILAGALQDYDRALIVGTGPTHGKGTVQAMVDLDRLRRFPGPPLGVLKLTIQQYFRVAGDSTQWRGVVPDVVLPDPAAHVESGERFLDFSIPWSEVRPLPHQDWPATKWDPAALDAASKKRRKAMPVFKIIDARSALLKKRRDDTIVPLERKAWLEKREADDKALDAVDPKLDEGKERFEVKLVSTPGKTKDPDKWKGELARDPWVEEALHILDDMRAAK